MAAPTIRDPYRTRYAGDGWTMVIDTRIRHQYITGGVIARCSRRQDAELIVKALNRLPETERAFRDACLAERRRVNNSPDGETT